MIINNEHKLCIAFDRLFKIRNTLKLCTLYTTRVNDACLPHHPCPGGGSIPGLTGPNASALPLSHGPPAQIPGFAAEASQMRIIITNYIHAYCLPRIKVRHDFSPL